jgi:Protein of unknown function (DUF2997)
MAEIVVRLRRDGTIEAVTHGLKGDACLPYIETVEQITDARTVDSYPTDEYDQRPGVSTSAGEQQIDVGGG